MTRSVRARIELPVAPATAFQAVVDLPSQGSWMLATQIYEIAGPARTPQVGARLAALTGLGSIGFLDTMEVTAFEPVGGGSPGRWIVQHTGRFIRGTGEFTVTAGGGENGCTVSWVEHLDPPFGWLGRLGWPLAAPLVRWGLVVSLRRLAAGLGSGRLPLAGSPDHGLAAWTY